MFVGEYVPNGKQGWFSWSSSKNEGFSFYFCRWEEAGYADGVLITTIK